MFKRPESILLVVYTQAGEVLLLQRRTPPVGVWQSVTGSLRWGEQAYDAACRELLEETGIQAQQALQATGVVNRFPIVAEARPLYADRVTENTEYVFTLALPDRCELMLNMEEHCACRWLPFTDAINLVWSWSNRQAIQKIHATIPE